jgi:two-component system response regulator AtoC
MTVVTELSSQAYDRVLCDPATQELDAVARLVAAGQISVLLIGETGSGKEVFAEAIHRGSPRASGPFLRLNCAALSETLLESELFGHERGAFTGATQMKLGLLESANGGTVFLDEIGEMPAALQAKLLRVIEQRSVMRVGGLRCKPIDVRFVSATNRDLEAEVEQGRFRRDLYYRINGAVLAIPPLRERRSEILPLARLFLKRAAQELGRESEPEISDGAMQRLLQHSWPGNVRELRNVMERAILLSARDAIGEEHLAMDPPKALASCLHLAVRKATGKPSDEALQILLALNQCAGNQTAAARMLGMPRQRLIRRIIEYRISRPKKDGLKPGGALSLALTMAAGPSW